MMVETEETQDTQKNGLRNGLVKQIVEDARLENLTSLDLSNKNISSFDEDIKLPLNLVHLDISKNNLSEVPTAVLSLVNLQTLNLSFNSIVYFDDPPSSCHTLEEVNLSNNKLESPPLWVWTEKPELHKLNISNNRYICKCFTEGYFEELLKYPTLVNEVDMHNCNLSRYVQFMSTFCNAKVIILGSNKFDHMSVNNIEQVPCLGLDKCCDIEKLDLRNTQIYTINCNIDIYPHLKELNLALNNINSLPNEFCNLVNLETCVLSCNKILYLPDNLSKLTKLHSLYLDNNELCMLPDDLLDMPSLKTLDLYNNNLCDGLNNMSSLEELDLAQNYFDEPDSEDYLVKKEKLRINALDRLDGRRAEVVREESEYSKDTIDDEELIALEGSGSADKQEPVPGSRSSSPEDWDSDDYWIPHYYKPVTPPSSPWLYFVKKKMAEGNFCPMDAHPISVTEKIKYEKMCNPPIEYECDGQFDDYSDDDS